MVGFYKLSHPAASYTHSAKWLGRPVPVLQISLKRGWVVSPQTVPGASLARQFIPAIHPGKARGGDGGATPDSLGEDGSLRV